MTLVTKVLMKADTSAGQEAVQSKAQITSLGSCLFHIPHITCSLVFDTDFSFHHYHERELFSVKPIHESIETVSLDAALILMTHAHTCINEFATHNFSCHLL